MNPVLENDEPVPLELASLNRRIIRHLQVTEDSRLPVYVEIGFQMKLGRLTNPDLMTAFEAAVRDVGQSFGEHQNPELYIPAVLQHPEMLPWHEQYTRKFQTRADCVAAFLEYVGCVGPALGRSLLAITNMRYMVFIALRLYTRTGLQDAGRWREADPDGETFNGEEWVRGDEWSPNSTGLIRTWFVLDYLMGCRLVPEHREKSREQIEDIDYTSKLVDHVRDRVRQNLQLLNQFTPQRAASGEALPIPRGETTAFGMAFGIKPSTILEHESYAARTKRWKPVWLAPEVRAEVCSLLQATDDRAHHMRAFADPEARQTGARMLTASIHCLVYAGMLRARREAQEQVRLLGQWPFSIPGTKVHVTRARARTKTVTHLGETIKQVGKQRLDLWCQQED